MNGVPPQRVAALCGKNGEVCLAAGPPRWRALDERSKSQSQAVTVPQQTGISESTARSLLSVANFIYQATHGTVYASTDVRASSMSRNTKSVVLWDRQYRYGGKALIIISKLVSLGTRIRSV